MTVVRRVDMKDIARVLGDHARYSVAEQRKAVLNGVLASLPDLIQASPVDTGQYAASWAVEPDEDGEGVTVGNYAPHAGFIEVGTRPFTPPLGPLLAWAKRVLQDPSQPPEYSPEVWALAKAVQHKIAERGITPKHVMQNCLPLIEKRIQEELAHYA